MFSFFPVEILACPLMQPFVSLWRLFFGRVSYMCAQSCGSIRHRASRIALNNNFV
jgi:hypothetical protein